MAAVIKEAMVLQPTSVTLLKKSVVCEAIVSLSDEVEIKQLSALTVHAVYSAVDGSAIDHTVVDNVITITEDPCSNLKVIIFCIG